MPKNTPKNGFYFFMKSLEPELRREGRTLPNGMADVAQIASPRWKLLSQEDKDRFEQMARDFKNKMRGTAGDYVKLDNVGNVIAHRVDRHQEMETRMLKERAQVRDKWPKGKDLIHEDFYFIHFNTLCTTDDGWCLPCEIGLVEYSMHDGIKRSLHKFIHPGGIPLGYRYTCNDKSETTHQIPVVDFEHADSNYLGLVLQMENFINKDGLKEFYPPVYCKRKDIEETELCLIFLRRSSEVGRTIRVNKVYELEGLIVDMFAHLDMNMSKGSVSDMLATNIYDYNPAAQCKWHAEKDVKYCSLGNARRYAYIISDHLAKIYGFELTRNHLPDRSSVTDNMTVVYQPKSLPLAPPRQVSYPSSLRESTASHSTRFSSSGRSSTNSGQFPARDIRYARGDEGDNDDDEDISDTMSQLSTRSLDTGGSTISSHATSGVASRGRMAGVSSQVSARSVPSSIGRGQSASSWLPTPNQPMQSKLIASWLDTDATPYYPPIPPGKNLPSVIPILNADAPLARGRGYAPPNKF